MDNNKALDSLTRLGPGHFLAVITLCLLGAGGYFFVKDFSSEHNHMTEQLHDIDTHLVELGGIIERNTEHQDNRFDEFQETQTRWHDDVMSMFQRLVDASVANCFANANGSRESWDRCERLGGND